MIVPDYDEAYANYAAAQSCTASARRAYRVAAIAEQDAKHKLLLAAVFYRIKPQVDDASGAV